MAKSGKYTATRPAGLWTVQLDVDGNYPQNQVGVTLRGSYSCDYIFSVSATNANQWDSTDMWYKGADTLTINGKKARKVRIQYGADGSGPFINFYLYDSGGVQILAFSMRKASEYFREVEVEFDHESGVNPITSFNPYSSGDNHRAPSLPNADITVADTFGKAGIKINKSTGDNVVGTAGAGGNAKWSNNELHDAMQVQWSKSEAAQWAMWVFQANQHEDDHTGIMFDSIGNFQRCGTALFHGQSSYTGAPAGLVNRHKFHTLIHEMGHSFNLYHSWMKTGGTSNWSGSVVNEPEARSYMNYPDRVAAGYYGFFDTFEYRFSDQELKFLRHAPPEMVQPGGSAWGVDHAGATMGSEVEFAGGASFEQDLQLIVRSNKATPAYEYLELVNLELKLKNISDTDRQAPEGILEDLAHMRISVSRNGAPAKVFKPYATPCAKEDPMVTLKPGESIYGDLFLSAGKFGWAVSEPGFYQVIVSIHSHTEDGDIDIISAPFVFSVAEPNKFDRQKRKEQETLAQDIFSDEVGRTLAFGGTRVLTGANDVLRELTERFPEAKAATHAKVALAMPNARDGYKLMTLGKDGSKVIAPKKADQKEGVEAIKKVLVAGGEAAAETMGNIAYQKVSDKAARELKNQGDDAGAKQVQQNVLTTMEKRGVKLPEKVKKALETKAKG